MFNSFISSIMNMTAEVYVQQNKQDEASGTILREWVYNKTIICKIEPIKAGAAQNRSDNKSFEKSQGSAAYSEKLQLKVKCMELLSKRWRIETIRANDGEQVFTEIDKYGNPDSIFEVTASHAVLDPFGKVSYYEATLQRVPVQDNDKINY